MAVLFPLGLLGLVSAAIVVTTAVTRDLRLAATDCLFAAVLLFGIYALAGMPWQAVLISATASWSSALIVGRLLGRYGSLTLPLQVLLVLAVIGVLAFSLATGNPVAFWEPVLQALAEQLNAMGMQAVEPNALQPLAPLMTGMVASSAVISSALALMLGASWAASAGGPPFAPMFLGLRLGSVIGGMTALAGLGTMFGPGGIPGSLLMVLATGFAVQGLAVLHWQARAQQWPWYVMVAVYFPLLLGPMAITVFWLLLAGAGFVDNWYGLRRGGADVIK